MKRYGTVCCIKWNLLFSSQSTVTAKTLILACRIMSNFWEVMNKFYQSVFIKPLTIFIKKYRGTARNKSKPSKLGETYFKLMSCFTWSNICCSVWLSRAGRKFNLKYRWLSGKITLLIFNQLSTFYCKRFIRPLTGENTYGFLFFSKVIVIDFLKIQVFVF